MMRCRSEGAQASESQKMQQFRNVLKTMPRRFLIGASHDLAILFDVKHIHKTTIVCKCAEAALIRVIKTEEQESDVSFFWRLS